MRKSHNILPRKIETPVHEGKLLKTKKNTPETYSAMNTIYCFQQYLFKLKWVISSKMLPTGIPYSLLTSATDPLTPFPSLLIAVGMRCLVE